MSPTPPAAGVPRSADEVNRDIRALWIGPGGHPALRLSDEQRAEYHRLLAELERLKRGDVTAAA